MRALVNTNFKEPFYNPAFRETEFELGSISLESLVTGDIYERIDRKVV